MNVRAKWSLGFLAAALLGLVAACATSPTGRKQLILVPEDQMASLGAQAFQEVKKDTPIATDPAINNYVECVAQPIAQIARGKTDYKTWEIVVFQSDQVNAFALPGGKIGVYTGLLDVAKTDDQLAAVIGHEVGHVIARHGAERVSEGLVAQGGLAAIGVLSRDNPNRDKILALLGIGAQYGVLMPHNRTQESEADVIGLDLMARAGFNPKASIDLWKNMAQASKGQPPEFLSTHPSHETRMETLQSKMDSAMKQYQRAKRTGKTPSCGARDEGRSAGREADDRRERRQRRQR